MPEYGVTGATDTFQVKLRNQSLSPKVINYQITSERNWLNPISGSTVLLAPFSFSSLQILFTIPEIAAKGDKDTVMTVLTIGDSFSSTNYSDIT
jgi:hypothetical protein